MNVGSTIKSLFSRLLYSVALPSGVIVGSLYIFNSLGNIPFFIAIILAFATGFFVIYLVFKYWIDVEAKDETPQQQMSRFMIVFIVNVGINTEIVYLMVTYAGVPLLISQTVAAVVVAYESYYAYRSLVFKAKPKVTVAQKLQSDSSSVFVEGNEKGAQDVSRL